MRLPKTSRPLILEMPDQQTPGQQLASGAVTGFFWLVWLYLWLPVVTLLAWVFGLYRFHQHMNVLGGWQHLMRDINFYGLICGGLASGLFLWAMYNRLRFRGRKRRSHRRRIPVEEIASFERIDATSLARWQHCQRLVIRHTQTGEIEEVEAKRSLKPRERKEEAKDSRPRASLKQIFDPTPGVPPSKPAAPAAPSGSRSPTKSTPEAAL